MNRKKKNVHSDPAREISRLIRKMDLDTPEVFADLYELRGRIDDRRTDLIEEKRAVDNDRRFREMEEAGAGSLWTLVPNIAASSEFVPFQLYRLVEVLRGKRVGSKAVPCAIVTPIPFGPDLPPVDTRAQVVIPIFRAADFNRAIESPELSTERARAARTAAGRALNMGKRISSMFGS